MKRTDVLYALAGLAMGCLIGGVETACTCLILLLVLEVVKKKRGEDDMTLKEFEKCSDGTHVPLTCEDHPELRWSCKRVALSKDTEGKWRYNGSRNVFYNSYEKEEECECSSKKLYALIEEEKK